MPPEILSALLAHGGWGIALSVAILAWWNERKENRAMALALVQTTKEQVLAQQASSSAIEKLCEKIDDFLNTYTVRRPR